MIHRSFKSYFLMTLTLLSFFSFIIISEGHLLISSDEGPDVILFSGNIITMEETEPLVEAIAIKDELIFAVGNNSDILDLAEENTSLIDLQGKTVVPGFIDAHSHWIGDRGLTNLTEFSDIMETLVSSGWTSISELFVNQYRLNELNATDSANELRVRVNAYLPLSYGYDQRFGDWYQAYQPGYEFSSFLRIAGVKLFMDRWYDEETLFFNHSELQGLMQEAHDLGFQIAIHSVTTNATDVVLDSFEAVLGTEWNNQRHRIEHLVLLRDDQINRMANLGMYACVQFPWFNSDWIESEETPIPNTSQVGRWRDLLDAGVHVMGSTDFPYTGYGAMTPIQCISMAVTRIGIDEVAPPEYMSNQAITPEEALRLLTIDAAYGSFQEDVKGSIKVGKYADLVVLSQNPLTVPEQNINDTQILMTIIGGKEEYKVDNFYSDESLISGYPLMLVSIGMGIIIIIKKHKLDDEDYSFPMKQRNQSSSGCFRT